MDVIGDASNLDSSPADVFDDPADVGPTFRRQLSIEDGSAIFRAEDEMREQLHEPMTHTCLLNRGYLGCIGAPRIPPRVGFHTSMGASSPPRHVDVDAPRLLPVPRFAQACV